MVYLKTLLGFVLIVLTVQVQAKDTIHRDHLRHNHDHNGHNHRPRHNRRSSSSQMFDLSHTFVMDRMPLAQGGIPLEMSVETQDEGYGARSEYFEFCMDERLGTHINAPKMYHHINGSFSTDHIPLERLLNVPAVVIDLLDRFGQDHSRMLTLDHLRKWEEKHGQIPHGSYVILRTGWSELFRETDQFLGNFQDQSRQVYPGFSVPAVEWLLSTRGIMGLGTECIDVELGWKTKNQVKKLLAAQNLLSIVQLANLKDLPARHLELTISPLKLQNGAGGPARVFAVTAGHTRHHHGNHGDLGNHDNIDGRSSNKVQRSPATESSAQYYNKATLYPPKDQTLRSSEARANPNTSLLPVWISIFSAAISNLIFH